MARVSTPPVPAGNGKVPPSSHPIQLPVPTVLKLLRIGFRIGGRVSPMLAGRIAYALWFKPTRSKAPAGEQKYLESARIEQLDIHPHTITTYAWGQSGPVVLLVHGWSGRGTQLGAFAKPLLDAGYRVIAFDAPAHGKSSGKKTNIYEIADVIVSLQHHYGEFDSIITHSFGGPSTALALNRGLKTKRMVSISPPATTRWLVDKFLSVLRIPERAGLNMMKRFETEFGSNIWEDVSMINAIKDVTVPGLLIHDSNDEDVPFQNGQAVADAWTSASFIKTTGLGHRRILRDKTVIDSVVRFVNER